MQVCNGHERLRATTAAPMLQRNVTTVATRPTRGGPMVMAQTA